MTGSDGLENYTFPQPETRPSMSRPGLDQGVPQPSSQSSIPLPSIPRRSSHLTEAPTPNHSMGSFVPPGTLDPLVFLSNMSPLRAEGELHMSDWSEHDLVTDWPTGSTSGSGMRAPPIVQDQSEISFPTTSNHLSNSTNSGPPQLSVSFASPQHPEAGSSTRQPLTIGTDIQIEDVAPWNHISFFITIYLSYSHSLFPLVHRPSFSQSLAMRRDKTDRDYRAFVLGIGESIAQV